MIKEIKAITQRGTFKIRIEKGHLTEIVSVGDDRIEKETAKRNKDEKKIRYWMRLICVENSKTFKNILGSIKEDEVFFTPGIEMLKDEKIKWEQRLKKHQREVEEKIEKLQKETKKIERKINEYSWLE